LQKDGILIERGEEKKKHETGKGGHEGKKNVPSGRLKFVKRTEGIFHSPNALERAPWIQKGMTEKTPQMRPKVGFFSLFQKSQPNA